MKTPRLSRRMFIRGAGGVALAVPTLEAMFDQRALAQGGTDPKRYICLYQASGTYIKKNNGAFWYPGEQTAALSAASLPAVFSPFAANVGDFSIIRGLGNRAKDRCSGGGDHSSGVASYLTSTPYTNGSSSACTINGSSFDQAIAARNNLKAYALSAGGNDNYKPDNTPFDYGRTVSYLNGVQANVWLNPVKLFQTLFMGLPAGGGSVDAGVGPQMPMVPQSVYGRNRSILDSARSGIAKIKSKVGTADRQRLDSYFSGLRAFESTYVAAAVDAGMPMGGGGGSRCVVGAPPAASLNNEDRTGTGTDFANRIRAFADCMVLALQCNVAQVFSFMFEYENTGRQINDLPAGLAYMGADLNRKGSHLDIAHWGDGGSGEEDLRSYRCVTRDRYYFSHIVNLINRLKSVQDPSGAPILDNTVIQWGLGLYDGNHFFGGSPRVPTGLPTVLAGGRNFIQTGRFHMLGGRDLSDLYFSLNTKLGMGLPSFGGSTTNLSI